jgi:capsular polysaccharide biosynthesis protein
VQRLSKIDKNINNKNGGKLTLILQLFSFVFFVFGTIIIINHIFDKNIKKEEDVREVLERIFENSG